MFQSNNNQNTPQTTPKKPKKIDLKNLSKEDKVRYIGIAGIVMIGCSFMAYGYISNKGEDKSDTIEQMSNPEAELQKYNSKFDAVNAKKDPNMANDLEKTFAEEQPPQGENVNYEELDRQIANLGKGQPNPTPQTQQPQVAQNTNSGNSFSNGGRTGGSGRVSNSHNVYGNYDMWQTNEPSNSRIGYSNKNNQPPKAKQPQQTRTENIEYVETKPITTPQPQPQGRTSYTQQVVVEPKQVRAKLISQGYASKGRSISFMILEDTTVAGQKVKKGQIVTGIADEQNNRLVVHFTSIKINQKIYSASIELIGGDGMKGLPVNQVDTDNGLVENEIRNQAGSMVNNVPVIGGILSSTTRKNRSSKEEPIKLSNNITCYLLIYN